MWDSGTHQESCIDCGWHHDYLKCYFREGRKQKLRELIAEKQYELAALERYEAKRRLGLERVT